MTHTHYTQYITHTIYYTHTTHNTLNTQYITHIQYITHTIYYTHNILHTQYITHTQYYTHKIYYTHSILQTHTIYIYIYIYITHRHTHTVYYTHTHTIDFQKIHLQDSETKSLYPIIQTQHRNSVSITHWRSCVECWCAVQCSSRRNMRPSFSCKKAFLWFNKQSRNQEYVAVSFKRTIGEYTEFMHIHNQKPEINLNDHQTSSSHLIKQSISNTQTGQLQLFKELI